jgi:putative inorganic carbon (HCO3(-)) transporter
MSSQAHPASSLPFLTNLQGVQAVLLVIAAIAANFLWASGHDDQRCIEIVLLALLVPAMLAGEGMAGQLAWMRPASRRCLGAFFVLGAVSALGALSLRHAVYEWSIMLLLAMTAALLAAGLARAGASGLQMVLRCVVAVGMLHVMRIGLMYAAALASGVQTDMHALAVGFSNARFFNHAQTVLLPLIVLLFLQAPKGSLWRPASFLLATCWWAFMFLSEARASVLALGAGSVFAFALRRHRAASFLKAMLLTALAGALVYGLVFVLLPVLLGLPSFSAAASLMQRTAADPSSGRTLLWKLALQLAAAHPWLGIGPHHFAHEGVKLGYGAHPHNWLLQIGVEWGIPALLCLLGAVLLGARTLVRSGKRIAESDMHNQQILVAFLAACAATCVDGLFSGVLVMPQSQLSVMLVVACAAGWVRSLDGGELDAVPSPPLRFLAVGLVALALCGLAWSVASDFMRHANGAALLPAEQAMNYKGNWPRLWEAGYF